LRSLQIHIGLREIFGDDRGLTAKRELDSRLAWREALRRKAQSTRAACKAHFERFVCVGFEKQAAVGVGDRDGVIEHVTENSFERQLGMQKRGRFEQQIQFAKTAAGRFGTGDVFDARQKMRQGVGAGVGCGAIDDFVGIVETEGDRIAVLQFAAFGFFAVHEEAAALAAILDVILVALHHDRGAVARDAAIRQLEVIAGFRSTADEERHLRYANVTPRAVRRYNLEHGFGEIWNCIGHR
jgi:hypothetical protein